MSPTLLLTATITPRADHASCATDLVLRSDPKLRLQDYIEALDFYLKVPDEAIGQIIFVENSASDLSELRRIAERHPTKEVEFISFYGLDYPARYGRAFGEFSLMDHAFEHSELIGPLRPDDRFWKATGRLRLLNIEAMVAHAPRAYDLYCDLRDLPRGFMEMRVYSFTNQGYHRLLRGLCHRVRRDINDNLMPEFVLRRIIGEQLSDARIVPRFRTQPLIAGFSGGLNIDYARGPKRHANYYARRVLRKVVPDLWI